MISDGVKILNLQFVRHFIRIWIPLVLVLAIVIWLLHRNETTSQLAITQAKEQQVIELAKHAIASEQGMLRGDVHYLAEHTSLQQWLDTGKLAAKRQLSADFLAFTRHRRLYDQVRFLDETGQEVVRINWNNGQPQTVSANQLQNKSDRYYIRDSLTLDKGAIYISSFDLNLENKAIEQPIKPVIRLATPVFDRHGKRRGLVVLNYLGQRLLERLREIGKQGNGGFWLLNAKGYWLLGPDPVAEWGFMYPQREAKRFDRDYPHAWSAMQAGAVHAQLMNEVGLFTYAHYEMQGIHNAETWLLVSHVPTSSLGDMMKNSTQGLVLAFIILALLLTAVSGGIAYHTVRRQNFDARIRDNEARFRGLLESAPDAIVIVDQDGKINLVNSQTEKWFGYSRAELLGQPVEKLIPQRFHKHHIADRNNYIVKPNARPMGVEKELFAVRKDGSEFPVEISLSPLQTEHGLLVTSIVRDISARKKVEQAQHQVEVRYEELVNNLPVGVYRNTPGDNGHFLEVNPAMVKIFEADSSEQLLAHSVSDLYCDPAARKVFSNKISHQGYVHNEELHLKTLKGREFCASITAVMKHAGDGSIYFDGIVEDISERKRSEIRIQQLNDSLRNRSIELEATNQELEAFSYSVSHDLRAPLRAIDGFSHMLLNNYAERLDDKGRDRLNRVRSGAQRMAALIDDLLKLSRVTRTDIKREQVDLSQMANDVIEELRQGDPQRQVQFSVQPDLMIDADITLLRVVMDNLLGNAWKFTSHNDDAMIEMGRSVNETEERYFVRDNGAGFEMAYADKLFGAFQRLHDSSEFPGTGIGLATVQRVINKHGGRIWAESAEGQGATFYFTLKQGEANE